jgi:hypothetical protein
MAVREDCRHYLQRTTAGGDTMRRCRVDAAAGPPFACPEGCLFFEPRKLSTVGWAQETGQPLSNTSLGLAGLPPPRRPAPGTASGQTRSGGGKNKKKGRRGH